MARRLTKRNKEGVPYTRPPDVEAEIDGGLLCDLPALCRRLLITEKASPDYLRSETLVHILRAALRSGDDRRRDATLVVLLGRCEAILKAKISNRLPNADLIREDVLSEFSEILATDGSGTPQDELDYYECCFNKAFSTFRIDVFRRERAELKRAKVLPDGRDAGEQDAYEPDPFDDACASVVGAFRTPSTQQKAIFLDELFTAINALRHDERRAVILVHVMGHDVESDDQNKVTAATLCQCTGRTIRNRLSRAAAKLIRFKEDV